MSMFFMCSVLPSNINILKMMRAQAWDYYVRMHGMTEEVRTIIDSEIAIDVSSKNDSERMYKLKASIRRATKIMVDEGILRMHMPIPPLSSKLYALA